MRRKARESDEGNESIKRVRMRPKVQFVKAYEKWRSREVQVRKGLIARVNKMEDGGDSRQLKSCGSHSEIKTNVGLMVKVSEMGVM